MSRLLIFKTISIRYFRTIFMLFVHSLHEEPYFSYYRLKINMVMRRYDFENLIEILAKG